MTSSALCPWRKKVERQAKWNKSQVLLSPEAEAHLSPARGAGRLLSTHLARASLCLGNSEPLEDGKAFTCLFFFFFFDQLQTAGPTGTGWVGFDVRARQSGETPPHVG